MLMTWPFLRRMRPGRSSRVMRNRPVRFASIIPPRSSSSTSATGARPSAPPALLMRISGVSSSAATANLWIASRTRTSRGSAMALGDPALRAASATLASRSVLRAPSTRGWPSLPKARANASPNPEDAPVMTTVPGMSQLPHVERKRQLPASLGVRPVAGLDDLDARHGFAELGRGMVAGGDRGLELLEERVEPLLVRGVHPVALDDAPLDLRLALAGASRQLPVVVVDDQGAFRVRRPEGVERDGANVSDAARADGLAGELHHRSVLVVVRGEDDAAVLAGRKGQLHGLRDRGGERLLAKDVRAAAQRGESDVAVEGGRGRDVDEVEGVFAGEHLLVGRVEARLWGQGAGGIEAGGADVGESDDLHVLARGVGGEVPRRGNEAEAHDSAFQHPAPPRARRGGQRLYRSSLRATAGFSRRESPKDPRSLSGGHGEREMAGGVPRVYNACWKTPKEPAPPATGEREGA